MHKINCLPEIKEFRDAVNKINSDTSVKPSKRWERFRDDEQDAYKKTVDALKNNQGSLCAYCECNISNGVTSIEHFIPKSQSTIINDYVFEWNNLLLCCKSIETATFDDKKFINIRTCNLKKEDINPIGRCLNPYELSDDIIFYYKIEEQLFYLTPNYNNNYAEAIVNSTIECLGLNSPILLRRRFAQFYNIKQMIKEYEESKEPERTSLFNELKEIYNDNTFEFTTTVKLIIKEFLPEAT